MAFVHGVPVEEADPWFERAGLGDISRVSDPALASRGMVAEYALADGTRTPLLALPWRADGERPPVTLPPPALGQHTDEFLRTFAPA